MLLAHLALLAPVLGAPVVRLEFGADAPLYLQARLAELLSTDAPSTLLRVDIGMAPERLGDARAVAA